MGYRLSIDAIGCDYFKDEDDDPRLHYHIKQLYYGTKLYGYGLDLEESLSYNFLLSIGKFEENYISKDKIKEKIKELKKQYDEDMENLEKGLIKGSSAIINNNIKINILQELLVSGQESG